MTPYQSLPDSAFWKLAVASRSPYDISDLWRPKFALSPDQKIATYGSCFAQHIGRALRERGFRWLDCEPGPYGLSSKRAREYNYGVFSSRTGNIYTTSLLRQWTQWAFEGGNPPPEVWRNGERFIDPFRPTIEPDGFESVEELEASRRHTIGRFERSVREADLLVFTLGLTESWSNRHGNYEYPMCPGVAGGEFEDAQHMFRNQQFNEVIENLRIAIRRMKSVNPRLRVLLTVSPVPLTATCSGRHVLVATMQSKSVLRAVAAQLSDNWPDVDYFPSYEIISSPVFRGAFFEPNLRSVHPRGVDHVMDQFFRALKVPDVTTGAGAASMSRVEDLVCEEALLEAFGSR